MIGLETVPRAGQIVGVRQRLYLVEQVVGPVNPSDSTLVQLSCRVSKLHKVAQVRRQILGFVPLSKTGAELLFETDRKSVV